MSKKETKNISGFDSEYKPNNIYDTKEYRIQNEKIASGLQAVDNLKNSSFYKKIIPDLLNGKITYDEFEKKLLNHYSNQGNNTNFKEQEADIVSIRIQKLLSNNGFSFNPDVLKGIHKFLFNGLKGKRYNAGNFKKDDWIKDEPILYGDTVEYGFAIDVEKELNELLENERHLDTKIIQNWSKKELISHINEFITKLWQIHPFDEGNTRTTTVFLIKYLRKLRFDVKNEPFEKNSLYFRNALVRNSYFNIANDIKTTDEFLTKFFENLLLHQKNKLDVKEQYLPSRNWFLEALNEE